MLLPTEGTERVQAGLRHAGRRGAIGGIGVEGKQGGHGRSPALTTTEPWPLLSVVVNE